MDRTQESRLQGDAYKNSSVAKPFPSLTVKQWEELEAYLLAKYIPLCGDSILKDDRARLLRDVRADMARELLGLKPPEPKGPEPRPRT